MAAPFHGLVVCPTFVAPSVSDTIAQRVKKLGGTFTKDLTRLVNVLVVGELFTPKYSFAVKNRTDIVFIGPDCIEKLYELWLQGTDLSQLTKGSTLAYLKQNYSLPPFEHFNVFIGRIKHGGSNYSLDSLVKDCHKGKVYKLDTEHFVRRSSASDKNSALTVFITDDLTGSRVQAAMEEKVPVIHPKWVSDCIIRGATLDFNAFYLLQNCQNLEFKDIGLDSFVRDRFSAVDLSGNGNANIKSDGADAGDANTVSRPIISTTSEPNGLKIAIDKLKPQATQLWGKLLSHDDQNQNKKKIIENSSQYEKADSYLSNASPAAIFSRCHFVLYKFEDRQVTILSSVIHGNYGSCSLFSEPGNNSVSSKVYYIAPSHFVAESLPKLPDGQSWLTEFFVERCLYYNQLLKPDSWCLPFYNDFKILPSKTLLHGSNNRLSFHITGFHGVELLHINKIIDNLKHVGFDHHEKLTKKTDFLIVNISQLTSIPSEHTLRQNKYASMFRTDLDPKISPKQALMFKNSMKKKIEFVKKIHPIPILTPSFVIELFHRSLNALHSSLLQPINIYLNDANWCISCPKGSNRDFALQIIPQQSSLTMSTSESTENPGSAVRAQNSPSSAASEPPRGTSKSNRWGKLLSTKTDPESDDHSFTKDDTVSNFDSREEDELSTTQVTYGSVQQHIKRRKVSTRSQTKDITSRV